MRYLLKGLAAFVSIVILLMLIVQFCILLPIPNRSLSHSDFRPDIRYSDVPTIMIPGWGGNTTTYYRMVRYFQKEHYAQKVMTVWVSPSGNVKTSGNYRHQKNAIIQILYNWNYNATYHPQVRQLTRVLTILHNQYHIKRMNVVAHSYGGTEFIHAYMGSKTLQKDIQLNKVIFLGVPVEESFGVKVKYVPNLNKKSKDRNFHQLERNMSEWDPQSVVRIYNIMGGADQSVPRIQSEMLQALVQIHPEISYHQMVVPKTSHFQLHDRKIIMQRVAQILWAK